MELHIDEEKVVQIVNSAIDSFKDGHLDGLKEEVQQLKQKKHELLCETEKQAEVRKNVENDINELKNNRMALQVEIIKLKEDKKNLKSNVEHLNEDIKKLLEKRKAIQEENRKIEEYLPEIKELLRLQKVADKTNGDYHKFRGIDNNYEWAAYSSLYEFLYEKFKKEIQRHNQDGSLFDYLTDRI